MPLLGAHISIAEGIQCSVTRALEIGCGSFQIFTRNQRRWKASQLKEEEISGFKDLLAGSGLGPVLAHGSYLMNLAAPDDSMFDRSVAALIDELSRCSLLGIPYLVVHPGSHLGSGMKAGSGRVAEGLDMALNSLEPSDTGCRPMVLLETTAGQGSGIGSRFEELGLICGQTLFPDRVGVCIDTCHIFAAGYDISTRPGYRDTMELFEDSVGMDRLKAIHLNDSLKGVGTKVDRHANIGEGKIGREGFRTFVNDRRFERMPMILETPGGDAAYRKDLSMLRSLLMRP
ncbi:MAG: deoxyribonuclease IV [Candidatus Thermoplasmatota archaeon]|nr:deoxyribonuclease IV [Candidatus Thermoplasmatota archaeon]